MLVPIFLSFVAHAAPSDVEVPQIFTCCDGEGRCETGDTWRSCRDRLGALAVLPSRPPKQAPTSLATCGTKKGSVFLHNPSLYLVERCEVSSVVETYRVLPTLACEVRAVESCEYPQASTTIRRVEWIDWSQLTKHPQRSEQDAVEGSTFWVVINEAGIVEEAEEVSCSP